MKQDDLMAALERLLDPDASDGAVAPYWRMSAEAPPEPPAALDGLAPDLAAFLSDGLADGPGHDASLADMTAYLDGRLGGAERDAFEAAMVASPELRAEVEALADGLAMLDSSGEDDVVPASGIGTSPL